MTPLAPARFGLRPALRAFVSPLPSRLGFLVTFTVPQELRELIRAEQKTWYGLLFRESAATLQEVAAREKYLGGSLGMLGVLHTWSRQLVYHPHVHYIVAGAGLSEDGLRWRRLKDPQFFLPEKVLARRFRTRLLEVLKQEHPALLARVPGCVWRKEWVVDCLAVGTGERALGYLSTYVYRTALTSARIVADDERGVTFRFRNSEDGRYKTVTVSGEEFVRRFVQHVLPKGFQRVRYYGWWSAAAKGRWERIEALLDWKRPAVPVRAPIPPPECPHCRQPMLWAGEMARAPP